MRRLAVFLVLLIVLGAPISPKAFAGDAATRPCKNPPAQFILMRHACKSGEADDEPLCASGWDQAKQLKERLKDYRIGWIYVTRRLRNQQTAQFIQEVTGLKPIVIDTTPEAAKKMVLDACSSEEGRDKAVLYIGNSGTLSGAFEALGLPAETFAYADISVIYFEPKSTRLPASGIKCASGCIP